MLATVLLRVLCVHDVADYDFVVGVAALRGMGRYDPKTVGWCFGDQPGLTFSTCVPVFARTVVVYVSLKFEKCKKRKTGCGRICTDQVPGQRACVPSRTEDARVHEVIFNRCTVNDSVSDVHTRQIVLGPPRARLFTYGLFGPQKTEIPVREQVVLQLQLRTGKQYWIDDD